MMNMGILAEMDTEEFANIGIDFENMGKNCGMC
jgi:hypothetical protein